MQMESNDVDSQRGGRGGRFSGRRTAESERTLGRNDLGVADGVNGTHSGGRFKNRHF